MPRGRQLHPPNPLPEWFLNGADNELYRSKDVAYLLGYKSMDSFYSARRTKVIPRHDATSFSRQRFWMRSTIIQLLKAKGVEVK